MLRVVYWSISILCILWLHVAECCSFHSLVCTCTLHRACHRSLVSCEIWHAHCRLRILNNIVRACLSIDRWIAIGICSLSSEVRNPHGCCDIALITLALSISNICVLNTICSCLCCSRLHWWSRHVASKWWMYHRILHSCLPTTLCLWNYRRTHWWLAIGVVSS